MKCASEKTFCLFKGDDTDFFPSQKFVITLHTERSLSGISAHFRLLDYAIDFAEIPESRELAIEFPRDVTSKFPLGRYDAVLYLTSAEDKKRTISNRIHFEITNSTSRAYDSEEENLITLTFSSGEIDELAVRLAHLEQRVSDIESTVGTLNAILEEVA